MDIIIGTEVQEDRIIFQITDMKRIPWRRLEARITLISKVIDRTLQGTWEGNNDTGEVQFVLTSDYITEEEANILESKGF